MKRTFMRGAVVGVAVLVAGAAVAAATAGRSATILVCGLMPDTKTSTRWEQKDKPALVKAFKAAGVPARVVNAQGDAQKQKTQADQCIADGAKVLIIAPIDAGSAAAIQKAALKQGVKSIDYDRQVEGGVAALYASFDGHTVGVMQARGVIGGLKATGKYGKKPVVASLWGGREDANAFLFKGGVDSVMNPLYRNGTFVKGPQQFVPGWNNQTAATIFQQMLVRTGNKIDAVAAANDGIAGASRRGNPEGGEAGSDPAERPGRDHRGCEEHHLGVADRVAVEDQRALAAATAKAAIAIAKGKKPPSTGYVTTKGRPKELAYLIAPIQLTKANWKRVITSGYYKKSEICNGEFAKYC